MTIEAFRDRSQKMRHTVHVRQHAFAVDEPARNGRAEDLGLDAGTTSTTASSVPARHWRAPRGRASAGRSPSRTSE